MGNKGAFITLSRDLKPHFTTYEAVVSAHYIIITSSFIPSLPPCSLILKLSPCNMPVLCLVSCHRLHNNYINSYYNNYVKFYQLEYVITLLLLVQRHAINLK